MTKEKPPTIRVGVSGIDAAKQKGDQGFSEPAPIDWRRLSGLPSFQMFVVEFSRLPPARYEEWMTETLPALVRSGEADAFYAKYCEWHKAKGYWPNETPMGDLINEH